MIPGRYGQVEYLGEEHGTGERRLHVSTHRPRLIARLRALPGLHAQQVGDAEARFWFPAGARELLTAVCGLIRARIRRRRWRQSLQASGARAEMRFRRFQGAMNLETDRRSPGDGQGGRGMSSWARASNTPPDRARLEAIGHLPEAHRPAWR